MLINKKMFQKYQFGFFGNRLIRLFMTFLVILLVELFLFNFTKTFTLMIAPVNYLASKEIYVAINIYF